MRARFSKSHMVRRILAVPAVAGMLFLGGPASPAVAQPIGPPPLDPGQIASSGPLGTINYPQKQACMGPNTGNSQITQKPWSQRVLGFEQAQTDGLTGRGTRIAVIDTGVNASHPRLAGRVDDGSSSVPGGGALQDCDGHGTIVAGIIGASADPNTGFVGVAPESTLISVRQSSSLFRDDQANRTIGNTETMAQAINYAVRMGADVINISQASCQAIAAASQFDNPFNQELHNAVLNAYNSGVVVVAAAGNIGEGGCQANPPGSPTTAVLPAWFSDSVLTVASLNQQGAPSQFSEPGPWVDVAAPGENLVSLDPGHGGTGLASQIATGQNGQMGPIQGTSFAAPYVSGLAALIKEKYEREGKQVTARQIINRIEQTAVHPGGNDGRNDLVGYGMIDPMAALNSVIPSEYGKQPQQAKPARLKADVIPKQDWPALMISFGGAGAGIAAIIFTAFLINAARNVRARAAANRDRE